MKTIICVCFLAVVAVAFARPNEQYPDKYDNMDVNGILTNERLYEQYFSCLIGKGRCPPPGTELKIHMVDALENNCDKCTEIQKKNVETVAKYMINKKPDDWKKLSAKYDPDNKFTKKYEEKMKKLKD